MIGSEVFTSSPFSVLILFSTISRCNSPIPDIKLSPVCSLISIFIEGSSFATFLRISTSFGRSLVFFTSIAFVITGSKMCLSSSKGVSGSKVIVSPASPVTPDIARTFPGPISSICSGFIPL